MKLLHITSTHLKPDGGVPVVLKNLVIEQNKIADFEAKVISVSAPVNEMNCEYFEYIPISNFEHFINEFKPDIVILHSFYYIKYNKIVRILSKHKIKYYIEPHGSFGKSAMKKSKIKKLVANKTIFLKQIKNAFGFIFLNDAEKKDSVYNTVNDIVIPNGIISNNIKTKILKKSQKDSLMYYIGRYDINHKGIDYLLDALDILETENYKFKLIMWGKGDNSTIDYINNRIKNYKNICVIINSSIYGEEKDNILEQIGPMILTSRYEGFPMTILEAWLYGNPCLVTPGTNVFDEIIANNLGWGVELSANSIADGIKKAILEYSLKYNDYILNCKDYVSKNYSWKKIAKTSYKLLNNIK